MLTELGKSAAQSLLDKAVTLGGPALVFWSLGLLMWMLAERRVDVLSVGQAWINGAPILVQGLILLWMFVLVAASSVLVERLTEPVLRQLEGYWPRWANSWRERRADAHWRKHDAEDEERSGLVSRIHQGGQITAVEQATWSRLEQSMRDRPSKQQWFMPTRTGNLLKSAETRPLDKYGLDTVAVWSCLWLLLPESTQETVAAARTSLDAAVASVVWGALFAVMIPAALGVIGASSDWDWSYALACFGSALLGFLVALIAILWWVPARAAEYGRLIESVFDVHRGLLYEALRWPMPSAPAEEPELGSVLTEYLWRGSDDQFPRFSQRAAAPPA